MLPTNRTHAVEYIDEGHDWPSEKVRDIAVRAENRLIDLLQEINKHTSEILSQHSEGGEQAWFAIAEQTGNFGFDSQMMAQTAEIAHLAHAFAALATTIIKKNNNQETQP